VPEEHLSEEYLLESLFHLMLAVKRQLHQQAEQLDLEVTPMHLRVIKIIDRKQPCTAIDIASFLGRDKAQVTRLINTLIDQELISKAPNPNDKRSQYLLTTERGVAVVEELNRMDECIVQRMTKGLQPSERAEFQRLARLMAGNFQGEEQS
jgi:DNA-binding MarR family transcriptional regulator